MKGERIGVFGAGVSGTAVMAAPAWLALAAMLAGGIVTHRLRG